MLDVNSKPKTVKGVYKTIKEATAPVIMSKKYHRYLRERAFFSNGEETIQMLIDDAVKSFYKLDESGKVIKIKKVS